MAGQIVEHLSVYSANFICGPGYWKMETASREEESPQERRVGPHAPEIWLCVGLSCLHALGCMVVGKWIVLSPTGTKKSERMGCCSGSRRGRSGRVAARRGPAVVMGTVTPSMRPLYRGGTWLCPHSTRWGEPFACPRAGGRKWLWLRWRRYCAAVVRKLFFRRSPLRAAAPARGRPREGIFWKRKSA